MTGPTPEQCAALADAAEEARKANYWHTADPYLIAAIGLVMLAALVFGWWHGGRQRSVG